MQKCVKKMVKTCGETIIKVEAQRKSFPSLKSYNKFVWTRKLIQSLVFAHLEKSVQLILKICLNAMCVQCWGFFRGSRSATVQSQFLHFFWVMLTLFPILKFFWKETQFKGREFPDWTSTHDEWKILEKDADSNYLIEITQHKDWCTLIRTKCSSVSLLSLARIILHQSLGNLCINQKTTSE